MTDPPGTISQQPIGSQSATRAEVRRSIRARRKALTEPNAKADFEKDQGFARGDHFKDLRLRAGLLAGTSTGVIGLLGTVAWQLRGNLPPGFVHMLNVAYQAVQAGLSNNPVGQALVVGGLAVGGAIGGAAITAAVGIRGSTRKNLRDAEEAQETNEELQKEGIDPAENPLRAIKRVSDEKDAKIQDLTESVGTLTQKVNELTDTINKQQQQHASDISQLRDTLLAEIAIRQAPKQGIPSPPAPAAQTQQRGWLGQVTGKVSQVFRPGRAKAAEAEQRRTAALERMAAERREREQSYVPLQQPDPNAPATDWGPIQGDQERYPNFAYGPTASTDQSREKANANQYAIENRPGNNTKGPTQ